MSGAVAALGVLALLGQYTQSRVSGAADAGCLYWREGTVIEYRQNDAGNPSTPGDAEFDAVQRSFDTWQEQFGGCGSLRLVSGGQTATRRVGFFADGGVLGNENVVVFRQRSCAGLVAAEHACWDRETCGNDFDCWEHPDQAIGMTTTSFHPTSGRIYDADIELNARRDLFTTVDAPVCPPGAAMPSCVATDVENTVTHEVGHVLGLAHSPILGSTMYANAPRSELSKRILDEGSRLFVCQVYPKGRPAQSCAVSEADEILGALRPACGCGSPATSAPAVIAAVALLATRRRRRSC